MDGLGRAVGAGVPFKLGDETVILQPLTLEDFGVLEQKILSERPNPMDQARRQVQELYADAAIPDDAKRHIALGIMREARDEARRGNKASNADVVRFMDSTPGLAFTAWLMLRREYGDKWTPEKLCEHIQQSNAEEVERLFNARDQASGIDDLGNSTGPMQNKRKNRKRGRRARRRTAG